jgi:hypothetical protein
MANQRKKTGKKKTEKAKGADVRQKRRSSKKAEDKAGSSKELAAGREKWESLRRVLSKLKRRNERLAPVDVFGVTREVTAVRKEKVEPLRKDIESLLSGRQAKLFHAALERLGTDCTALNYVYAMLQVEGERAVKALREELDDLLDESGTLVVAGKHWMGVLEAVGRLDPAFAAAIRAGTGYLDRAMDLQVLSPKLEDGWSILGPLQQEQKDESLRLSLTSIRRMRVVGTKLEEALRGELDKSPKGVDWREQVLLVFQLLEDDYHMVREAARYALRNDHRFEEAEELGTLIALHWRSRGGRPAKPAETTDTSSTPADSTPPPTA